MSATATGKKRTLAETDVVGKGCPAKKRQKTEQKSNESSPNPTQSSLDPNLRKELEDIGTCTYEMNGTNVRARLVNCDALRSARGHEVIRRLA